MAEELGSMGIFYADYRDNTITTSAGFRRIFGLTPSAGTMSLDQFLEFMHPDDRPNYAAERDRAVYGRCPLSTNYRIILADGRIRYIKALTSFIFDPAGATTHGSGTIMDISENVEAMAVGLLLADNDRLTGLPNRGAFVNEMRTRLADAVLHDRILGVLLIDIDRFTKLNDALGHSGGDKILGEISNRLRRFSSQVYSARIGGNEFGCLLSGVESELDMHELVHKIHATVVNPPPTGAEAMHVTCGAGLSMFPEDGNEGLFEKADVALAHAKHEGRGVLCRYQSDYERILVNERRLSNDLLAARGNEQFGVFYQPIVNAATKRIVGAEALIRWRHPRMGLLAPSAFLSDLEETGRIVEVGEWMLGVVSADLASLQQALAEPFRISINLAAQQLLSPLLVEHVRAALKSAGVAPSSLGFEVTEQTLISDIPRAAGVLKRLRALGTSVCIDDFGTGHNTLTHLKAFPIDCVKIDKSFVYDLLSNRFSKAICSSIADLGGDLNLCVIAEGVETQAQAALLTEMGCAELQGYLYGRAQPGEKFIHRLVTAGNASAAPT